MKRLRVLSSLAAVALAILAVLIFSGCGSGSRESPAPTESESSSGAVEMDDPGELIDQPLGGDAGFRDDGDPCREHRYRVFPGSPVTLSFEKLLPWPPQAGEPVMEITRDEWEPLGIEARVVATDIRTQRVARMRWGVDLADYAFARDAGGKPLFHLRRADPEAKGITGLKWLRDSLYVVSEINGRRWPDQILRNLTESDLQKICEGDAVFRIQDPLTEREIEFFLRPLSIDREISFAQVDIEMILTRDITVAVQRAEVRFESPQIGRIALRLAYNPPTSRFITISGPAFRLDCE